MSESKPKERRSFRRLSYLVDNRMQLTMAFYMLAVLVGVAGLYLAALFLLPGQGTIEQLNAQETREVMLRANLIYFVLAACILFTVIILVSHRVAGPAFVVERALKGINTGNLDQRLSLRKRDYLKTMAAEVNTLAQSLRDQQELLQDLDRCLGEKDVSAARELVQRLLRDEPAKTPGEPEAVEASEESVSA